MGGDQQSAELGVFIFCDRRVWLGIGQRVDVGAQSRRAPSLASILAGSGGNHASSAMGDRIRTGGAGLIVLGTCMSLVVVAYLVWFTHRKAGRHLPR